jgi:hypothetical protein
MPHHFQHRDSTTSVAPSDAYTVATTPSSLDDSSDPPSFTLNVASTMKVVPLSPAVAGFSFDTNSDPTSSSHDVHSSERHQPARDLDDIMRHVNRDTPGSPRNFDSDRKSSQVTDSRRMTKMSYYEDSFASRHDWETSTHDRVVKDSPVLAELRTNVIVSVSASPHVRSKSDSV